VIQRTGELREDFVDGLGGPFRLKSLDGLRGLAILLVLIWHIQRLFPPDTGFVASIAHTIFRLSWSGVDLFFVLSGFLIGGVLLDNRQAINYWSVFYTRRAFRILPLYLTVVASFIVSTWLLKGDLPGLLDDGFPIFSYLTLTQNFWAGYENKFGAGWLAVTWSLAVEDQFYLVFPILIRLLTPKSLPLTLMGTILFAVILRAAIFHWFSKEHLMAVYVLTPCRSDALMMGALCAIAVRDPILLAKLKESILRALGLIGIVGIAYLTFEYDSIATRGMILFGYSWLAASYSVFLLIVVTSKSGMMLRITTLRFLRYLGDISFALYLFHLIVIGLFSHFLLRHEPRISDMRDFVVIALAIASAIGLATLSLRLFERPMLAIGKRSKFIFEKANVSETIAAA
jgi:peptidoglycan/LPS O-acetylase OafA/YrhL